MDWSSTLLLLFIFILSYIILSYRKIFREKAMLPPGPLPIPLLGNLLQIDTGNVSTTFMKMKEKYGPVFTLYFGSKPGIVVCGYKAMKEAFIDQNDVFGDRGDYPVFRNFIGEDDIAFANGDDWKRRRQFTLLTLRNFGMGKESIEKRILEEGHFLIKGLKETKGSPVDPQMYLSRTVSNVICSVVFGKRFDYGDKRLTEIINSVNSNFSIMSSMWGTLYNMYPGFMEYIPGRHKKMWRNFQDIYDITDDFIKDHEKTLDPKNPRDYIDCFLIKMKKEEGSPGTPFYLQSLRTNVQDLLFGGTETTSTTLRYGILILMRYPEIAERMQEEIDKVIGRDRNPSIADRNHMPYTEATIYEIMRYVDVIPLSLPHLTSTDTVLQGFSIPKGTYVSPLLTSVHYDPEYYDEPDKFNPNHFLDDQGNFKKNDAHIPFLIGKRMCLGASLAQMELFLFFTSLLQNFTFKPVVPNHTLGIRPIGSGLGNLPPQYKCCFVPR
ncbi:cytochrome P450 2F2-like [Leptodactylus fuscus]|uniref:cytochrome P450 2F2-like n=1 Tax=Leptodactylus fuscus TaxID=238119 RepID=UPI003F4EC159